MSNISDVLLPERFMNHSTTRASTGTGGYRAGWIARDQNFSSSGGMSEKSIWLSGTVSSASSRFRRSRASLRSTAGSVRYRTILSAFVTPAFVLFSAAGRDDADDFGVLLIVPSRIRDNG